MSNIKFSYTRSALDEASSTTVPLQTKQSNQ